MKDREIIGLYHAHGKYKQYHNEIKSDMDLEHLPSGKFETNELMLELGLKTYNILRMIEHEFIGRRRTVTKHKVKRHRLRAVIGNMVIKTCHVTKHACHFFIGLSWSNPWWYTFREVHTAFADFRI